jgi:hypothetical protein
MPGDSELVAVEHSTGNAGRQSALHSVHCVCIATVLTAGRQSALHSVHCVCIAAQLQLKDPKQYLHTWKNQACITCEGEVCPVTGRDCLGGRRVLGLLFL